MTTHTASFSGDPKVTLQAMYAAGGAISTLRMKIAGIIQVLALGFLVPLGLIAIAIYFFRDFTRDYTFAVVLFALFFGWAMTGIGRLIYRDMAHVISASPFATTQHVEIGPDGVAVSTRNSHWRTGWADITAVRETKLALCVVVSGVALSVPKDALDDPAQTFADMQGWHKSSVFA